MGASEARKAKRLRDGTTKPPPSEPKLPPAFSMTTAEESATELTLTKPTREQKEPDADEVAATEAAEAEASRTGKPVRFIVFIGNLPYTATKDSLSKHFKLVQPTSVRLITRKEAPSECKGFAFLEFEKYDRMKLCLENFHHSTFEDGTSPARKINAELTAGGGGGTKYRKDRLRAKNEKLNEQRRRRRDEEKGNKSGGVDEGAEEAKAERENDSVHPSRRRRMK